MAGPFKMKGYSYPGTSPIKKTEANQDYRKSNLLKAVPNQEAYDKLSDINKKGFDTAAKEAGFPMKKSPAKQKTKKIPKRPGLDTSKQKKTNIEQPYSKKIYTDVYGDLFKDEKGNVDITKKDADRLYRESGGKKKYDYRGKTNR